MKGQSWRSLKLNCSLKEVNSRYVCLQYTCIQYVFMKWPWKPKPQNSDKAVTLFGISGFHHVLLALFDLHVPFSPFLRTTIYLCQQEAVLGNPTDEVKGGRGWGGVGWGQGHPTWLAKEWLIRQAGINEKSVCPRIGLAADFLEFGRFRSHFPPEWKRRVSPTQFSQEARRSSCWAVMPLKYPAEQIQV